MNRQKLLIMLKAVADEHRLEILNMLKSGELCACKFHEPLGLSQNLASHHLTTLRVSGLVKTRKVGRNVFYSLNQKNIITMQNALGIILLGGENGNKNSRAGVC